MKKAIIAILAALLCAIVVFAFSKYVLPVIMPFILAAIAASLLRAPISFFEKRLKLPKRLSALIVTLAFLLLLSALIFGAFALVFRQGGALVLCIGDDIASLIRAVTMMAEDIGDVLLRFGIEFDGAVPRIITEALERAALDITSSFTSFATKRASAVPSLMMFLIVFIISCFYFCADNEKITSTILTLLPKRVRRLAATAKKEFDAAVKKYITSYLLIFFLTFGELFLGFTLIGVGYAPLLSVITAVIDILPVFGTGTVIIPLAIARALLGDMKMCFSLMILYAVITIIRQIAEPRIIGGGMGLHPALSLFLMYVGLKIFGIIGMISFPIAFAISKNTVLRYKEESA